MEKIEKLPQPKYEHLLMGDITTRNVWDLENQQREIINKLNEVIDRLNE